MTPADLNKRLTAKAEAALKHLFQGAGKFASGRFTIGNVQGDPGDSLFVYLKDGRFRDSQSSEKGDLLELFSLKHGGKQAGIDAAYSFLGIQKIVHVKKKLIPWKKPVKDWTQLTENPAVVKYLTEDRKIPMSVLKDLKVRAKDNAFYSFPTYTHDNPPVLCGMNYMGIKRQLIDGKEKKKVFQSDKPLATLFGHTICALDVKNAKGKTFIIVTEGQIDCMSLRSQGINNSVSIPFGTEADEWIENSWEFLIKFQEIYLMFDNDAAGMKATEKCAKRIGYERCRKVAIPAHINDINTGLLEGIDFHPIVDAAIEFKPDKLIEASEIFDEAIARMSRGRRHLQGIPFMGWSEPDESINFRIRPKEMTIYTGYPSSGKSNLLYQLCAYLVFIHNQIVVIASLEEDAEDILGIILTHAIGIPYDKDNPRIVASYESMNEEMRNKVFFYHHRNRAPFKDVLLTAEFAIRKHGAQHFIMDSVAKTDLNIENNEDANEFVGLMTTSMNETGAHYHLVAHSKKGPDKNIWEMPGLQEIKGANAFGVETFNVLSVWRDPKKVEMRQEVISKGFYEKKDWSNPVAESNQNGFKTRSGPSVKRLDMDDINDYPDAILWVCKQKVGGEVGKYGVFYDKENCRLSRHYGEDVTPYCQAIYDKYLSKEAIEEDPF
jgi:twinkle protein